MKAPPLETHPLIPNPVATRTEGNDLIAAIADRDDLDPIDVTRRATAWKGQGYTRLDTLPTLDRLAHTMATLRAWASSGRTPEQQAQQRQAITTRTSTTRPPNAAERATEGVAGALEILRRQDAQAGLRALPVGEVVDAH